ncbi:MAG: glycosyltransferase 87 family protein [Candidatus Bathyarchaeia archaeon]
MALILLAVAAARLPFLLGGVLGGDAAYHARAAVAVLNGGLLYRDVPYTYPPLYAYTEALFIAVLGDTNLGWKATAQLYDLGSLVLVYLIAQRIAGRKMALVAAALYGFSPLPFFGTSSFACFDSTAAFWMLAGVLLLLRGRTVPSAVALGVGAAYKYFPLLLLPVALVYLVKNHDRITYAFTSVATVALFQLPFMLTEFSLWLDNVLLFHVNRSAGGATIYNLLSPHPQLWDVQTPLTLLSPISVLLVFLLVALDKDRSEHGLLKKAALVMVTAVFFNKVVLFYALWFIPLLCTFLLLERRRSLALTLVPFFVLQVAVLVGGYSYSTTMTEGTAFAMCYIYLAASALILAWLMRDRLLSAFRARTFRNV